MSFAAVAGDFGWPDPFMGRPLAFTRTSRIATARLPQTSNFVAVGDIGCSVDQAPIPAMTRRRALRDDLDVAAAAENRGKLENGEARRLRHVDVVNTVEIEQCARTMNIRLTMSREARDQFLRFSASKAPRTWIARGFGPPDQFAARTSPLALKSSIAAWSADRIVSRCPVCS